jgi:maltooligosyltrehalose synthase
LIAFAREADGHALVTVATLYPTALLQDHKLPVVPATIWDDTTIILPSTLNNGRLTNVFDETTIMPENGRVVVRTVLASLPVAVLTCQTR